jgi:tetrathionate reductase subunit B
MNQDTDPNAGLDSYRRRFLGNIGIAAAGLALAPGVFLQSLASAKAPDEAVSGERRWGMLIDASRCAADCDACVRACDEEHGIKDTGHPQTDAQWIRKLNATDRQTGHTISLPMLCQHCEHPPCVDVCPTGASFRRADGIVLVDKHTCIGCRYCMMACPYKARSFIHEPLRDQLPHAPRGKGTVESCTLCVHRVDAKGDRAVPACAQACNAEGHKAMVFGDMNDPHSDLSRKLREQGGKQIRADLKLNTGVRYLGV